MNWQSVYRVGIRLVFLFAFVAFLSASISHVAVFFQNFEEDKSNWVSPYMLAISIDLMALMLTIGIMFFSKDMPWYAKLIVWVFIILLTAFSWTVNWEYAQTYQGHDLRANSILTMLNPVLASSFTFLNLAYSVVAQFFDSKAKTSDELAAEATRLEGLEEAQKRIDAYRDRNRRKSFIQVAKDVAIEAKAAAKEVLSEETKPSEEITPEAESEESITQPIIDELPVVEDEQTEEDNVEHNVGDNDEDNDLIQVLAGYPKVSSEWLAKGRKSASIDEIITVTGQNKRRLNKANLQRSSRNKDLILISAVIDWLKTVPLPVDKPRNTDPLLSVPVETAPTNGHRKVTQPLQDLVELEVL
jgi:hypothetical protein